MKLAATAPERYQRRVKMWELSHRKIMGMAVAASRLLAVECQ